MRERVRRTIPSTSSSLTSATRRHGSIPASKQPSDFQTFPIPAMLRWSSSASPIPRVGSSSRRRRMNAVSSSSAARMSGPSAARRRSKRVRLSVISSSTGPSNSTTSCSDVRITSHARRGERCQRRPRSYTPQAPPMRRCEWSVRSPSNRMKRCLPWASTLRTGRPSRRSGQRSIACRGCGVSIETISRPTSAAPTLRAAAWIVSPSGTERELPRPLPEPELDQQLLDRRAHDRLAVEALERELLEPPAADVLGERLECLAQPAPPPARAAARGPSRRARRTARARRRASPRTRPRRARAGGAGPRPGAATAATRRRGWRDRWRRARAAPRARRSAARAGARPRPRVRTGRRRAPRRSSRAWPCRASRGSSARRRASRSRPGLPRRARSRA